MMHKQIPPTPLLQREANVAQQHSPLCKRVAGGDLNALIGTPHAD